MFPLFKTSIFKQNYNIAKPPIDAFFNPVQQLCKTFWIIYVYKQILSETLTTVHQKQNKKFRVQICFLYIVYKAFMATLLK